MAEEKKSAAKPKKAAKPKADAPAAEAKPAASAAPAAERLHKESARDEKHCRESGCKRPYRAKGYCVTHYKLWRQGKHGKKQRYKTCSKEGCRKPMVRWGLCEAHVKSGAEEAAAATAAPA